MRNVMTWMRRLARMSRDELSGRRQDRAARREREAGRDAVIAKMAASLGKSEREAAEQVNRKGLERLMQDIKRVHAPGSLAAQDRERQEWRERDAQRRKETGRDWSSW